MKKDNIYSKPISDISDFIFDKKVTDVFDDMIDRSVPGYRSIVNFTYILTKYYAANNSHIYDLGCSTGASSLAALKGALGHNCCFIFADSSEAMIDRCKKNIKSQYKEEDIRFLCKDIRNIKITNASVVILNFTLQFLPPADRNQLISNIFKGMRSGGILILSEKINFKDVSIRNQTTKMHTDFKRKNGYSALEVSQKRTALEKVLHPETLEQHKDRLIKSGFHSSRTWFQYLNFMSMIAFK